jgi:hypothetical protein
MRALPFGTSGAREGKEIILCKGRGYSGKLK